MIIRKLSLATAVAGLAVAPVAVQAADVARAAPTISEASDMGADSGTPTFAIIAALIIVALVVLVATSGGEDPVSP